MKITELKDWNTLTPQEQARLRDVYQVGSDDELPAHLTKTMAQAPPESGPSDSNKTQVITAKEDSTVIVNAENVEVHEKEDSIA